MLKKRAFCGLLLLVASICGPRWDRPNLRAATEADSPWEADIRRFEEQDRSSPPPKDAVLFVGSSSVRLWDLGRDFPGMDAINRGFGGSQLADSVRFADRIVIPYRPRVVVLYAGDNDIASGKMPQQLADDFARFVKKVHGALPRTKIVYISIKPSLARWKLVDQIRQTNELIRKAVDSDKMLAYADIFPSMLGTDGTPRGELFVDDGLHLNADGYKLWAGVIKPLIDDSKSDEKPR